VTLVVALVVTHDAQMASWADWGVMRVDMVMWPLCGESPVCGGFLCHPPGRREPGSLWFTIGALTSPHLSRAAGGSGHHHLGTGLSGMRSARWPAASSLARGANVSWLILDFLRPLNARGDKPTREY
jgi:hypothetical protein